MQRRTQIIVGFYTAAALLGWLGAFAGSSYLKRNLPLPEDADLEEIKENQQAKPMSSKNTKRSTSKNQIRLVNSIIKKNIFDSTQTDAITPTKLPEGVIPISPLNVLLLGTVVVIPEELSIAWIKDLDTKASDGYQLSDKLKEATIKKIERERVLIERNGELEMITFDDGTKKEKKGGRGSSKSDDTGVEKTGRNKYTIDQGVLDEMLKDPTKLATQIRASAKKENGNVIGYRLSGIRRKSVFYKLGIKNGDVVHNVNGRPLTSMKEAMNAYKSLQNSKNFTFELTRRRKRRTHEYEVR